MENLTHTQAYAEKLASEAFPEKSHGSRDLEIAIENSRIGFKLGYMKSLEETAAPDMLEALIKIRGVLQYEHALNKLSTSGKDYTNELLSIDNAMNKATKQHGSIKI